MGYCSAHGFAYIDYAAAARQRAEWLAWLQAKAAERKDNDRKVEK